MFKITESFGYTLRNDWDLQITVKSPSSIALYLGIYCYMLQKQNVHMTVTCLKSKTKID